MDRNPINVAINPPAAIGPDAAASVIVSGAWPLKTHSMRGIVLGADASGWRDAAQASVLPGLRLVGQGAPPAGPGVELLGDAGGVWVVRRR